MGSKPAHRVTRQRSAVLSALQEFRKTGTHPTTDDVYVVVRQALPHISLATVYRNLDVLAAQGLVSRLDLGGSPVRFDGDTSEHMHLRCVDCDGVIDLRGVRVQIDDAGLSAARNYEIIGVRAELVGVCVSCMVSRKNTGGRSSKILSISSKGGLHGSDPRDTH